LTHLTAIATAVFLTCWPALLYAQGVQEAQVRISDRAPASDTSTGAGAMKRYGDVPAKTYGGVPAPKFGDIPTKKYENVPAPAPTASKAASSGSPSAPGGEHANGTPESAGGFDGHFFRMTGGSSMEMWDFSATGRYSRTRVAGGGGFSGRSSEVGTYSVSGGVLVLHPENNYDASATTAAGGKNSTLTGAKGPAEPSQRLPFKLLGSHGKNGAVIGGNRYQLKNW
jgi:hypothetical protein